MMPVVIPRLQPDHMAEDGVLHIQLHLLDRGCADVAGEVGENAVDDHHQNTLEQQFGDFGYVAA
ncbi:hypothetical protein D3C75_1233390 [compost metagenome]